MQYALLIYLAPDWSEGLSDDERQSVSAEYYGMYDDGRVKSGAHLQPVESATTVRVNGGGESLVTDGPFAETKEVFAGFYLIDAEDLDAALAIAGRIPAARMGGSVEVRPLVEMRR